MCPQVCSRSHGVPGRALIVQLQEVLRNHLGRARALQLARGAACEGTRDVV